MDVLRLAQTSADPYGGEILYRFANPEDFSLCDALALTLAVSDQEGNYVPAKLYLTLYGEDERVEGSCLIQNGKMTTVTLSGVALDSVKACSAVWYALMSVPSFLKLTLSAPPKARSICWTASTIAA